MRRLSDWVYSQTSCQAASRQDEAGVASRNLDRHARCDYRPPATWNKHGRGAGKQVTTCVSGSRVARRRQVRIEAEEGNFEHD